MTASQDSQPAALLPFEGSPAVRAFALNAWASRRDRRLEIRYRLAGAIDQLVLPEAVSSPCRRDGLWQSTCFEAFIANVGETAYQEVNLSPSGDWNIYRFSRYRVCPEPEPAGLPVQSRFDAQPEALSVALSFDLFPALGDQLGQALTLELALTVVLEHRGGSLSHWALAHPGPEPDFHDRRGFLLQIPAAPG